MTMPEPGWLAYSQVRLRLSAATFRQSEVPVEYAVSLPLPTHRCGMPGYAQFAAPAARAPERPVEQAAPDRWWVIDPRTARTVVYALISAVPFTPATFGPVLLPPVSMTMDQLRQLHQQFDTLMQPAAEAFLTGNTLNRAGRQQLAAVLAALVPAPLVPQYRALAPDFFDWIEAS